MTLSRRQYLGGLVSSASLALAGCQSGGGSDGEDGGGRSREDVSAELQLDGVTLDPNTPAELRQVDTGDPVVDVHYHGPDFSHWHSSPLALQTGEWYSYEVVFQNFARESIPLGDGEQFKLSATLADSADFVDFEVSGNRLDVRGTETGGAALLLRLAEGEETGWTAPALPLSIQG